MAAYLLRKIPSTLLVMLGVSVITFLLMHMSGDPAQLMLPGDATEEQIRAFRRQMGFDDPIYVQYLRFLSRAVRGDFGMSLSQRLPAFDLVWERIPATVELAVAAMLFALVIGLPVGVMSAVKKDTAWDYVSMVLALGGQSMPTFWLGIMLILVFSVKFRMLPTSGRGGLLHLVMPTVTLGTYYVAMISRLTRSGLLEVLGEDYIRTARAKGLGQRAVVFGHALRNSMIPLVTVMALQFGRLLGGAIITESVFEWPGVGRLAVTHINQRDFPVVQAVVFIMGLVFVMVNLVTDVVYCYLDPRIRVEGD